MEDLGKVEVALNSMESIEFNMGAASSNNLKKIYPETKLKELCMPMALKSDLNVLDQWS